MAKNPSGKKWSHKWAVVRGCVLPTCLQQLHYQNYLSVLREQRILQWNWCKIKMQYPYQISTGKLSFVTYPRHDFHISCKMLNSAPFFFSLKENWSDSVDTLRSLACLILCWNKKEKRLRSYLHPNLQPVTSHEQNAMKKFKHTLAKLSRTGTLIGQKCTRIQVNWILDFLAKETCLAKQKKS